MSIPKGTKVRLENGLDGTVTGYWHPRHEPEPEQPFKVPFPYWVVDSCGQSQVMNERELEVIRAVSADLVLYAVVHETCGHIAGIGQRRINAEVTCAALHAVSKYGWRVQRLSGDAVEQAVERFASGAKCPACEVRAS